MKKILLIASLFIFLASDQLNGQVQMGVKFGIHSFQLSDPRDIIFPNREGAIRFEDAKVGFQGGIYTRLKVANIFVEPRVMLHSANVEYVVNDPDNNIFDELREESFTNLDIPVLLGFKILFIEATTGPVAHINLNHASDLVDFDSYNERFKSATYGWRAGLGLSLSNLNIGFEFEGNFSDFGEHITIGGEEFSFDDSPHRLLLNIGVRLL